MASSPASWQADPLKWHQYRYWDGKRWTDHVADDGVQSVDSINRGPKPVTEPSNVVPIATKFDQAWFQEWSERIFADSGVDPTDELDRLGLLGKLRRLMHYWGTVPMEQSGATAAVAQFTAYLGRQDSTPWGAMSFIAGWNRRYLPAIEEQLAKAQPELTEMARKNGNLYDAGW